MYQELIGEFGEWGTIDRIDDITVEQLETIVKLQHNIILVYSVSFSTQTYSTMNSMIMVGKNVS